MLITIALKACLTMNTRNLTQQKKIDSHIGPMGQLLPRLDLIFEKPPHKILLVNLPQIPSQNFNTFLASRQRLFCYPPYGIGVVNAVLRQRGYISHIVDLNFEMLDQFHQTSDVDVFDYWKICRQELDKAMSEFCPDVVGLSCTFTMTHVQLVKVAQYLKSKLPSLPVVAGGVHPTSSVDKVLSEIPEIDLVFMNECEYALADMLDYLDGKSKKTELSNFAVKVGEKVVCLPSKRPSQGDLGINPDYDRLRIGKYSKYGEVGAYRFHWINSTRRAGVALSNRGCRARCSFCTVRNFNGKGVRPRSIDAVITELKELNEKYGVEHIMWLDDDLFFDEDRTIELFTRMSEELPGLTWDASNGVIAAAATEKILSAAAKSGCIGMHVGVESGSARILKAVHKPSGRKHYFQLGKTLIRYPQIFSRGFLMVGFPGETLNEILQTIDLARTMNLDWYTISLLAPLPETEIYQQMIDSGEITDEQFQTSSVNYGSSQTGSQLTLEQAQKIKAKKFVDYFATEDLEMVPSKKQLADIWFLMDYKINYERIFTEENADKLFKWRQFLIDVCDRMTRDNPLGNLFLGIVLTKIGRNDEAQMRYKIANSCLNSSSYWTARFKTLDLDTVLSARI